MLSSKFWAYVKGLWIFLLFDLLFNIDSIFPYVSILLKEFDNYAEWDLKDIDFVDDDSDVLRGGLHFVLLTTKQQQWIPAFTLQNLWTVSHMFLFFSTEACSCWYLSFKIKGETTEEEVGLL